MRRMDEVRDRDEQERWKPTPDLILNDGRDEPDSLISNNSDDKFDSRRIDFSLNTYVISLIDPLIDPSIYPTGGCDTPKSQFVRPKL
jgi:hypothetical protein